MLLVSGLFGCFLDENRVVFAGALAPGGWLVSDFIISSEVKNVYAYNKQNMLIV
jgi:hypothetical protein